MTMENRKPIDLDGPIENFPPLSPRWTAEMLDMLSGEELMLVLRTHGLRQVEARWREQEHQELAA